MKQSQRTKNRLREHKDHDFVRIGMMRRVPGIIGNAICFNCDCGWTGWLPADELESDNA